jgi:hypothetical protein
MIFLFGLVTVAGAALIACGVAILAQIAARSRVKE